MVFYERNINFLLVQCNSKDIEQAHKEGSTIYKYNDNELVATLKPEEDIPEGFIEPFSIIVKPRKEGEANG